MVAWISLVVAWMAAAIWTGAAIVRLLLASGDGKSAVHIDDETGFCGVRAHIRQRLCRVAMGAALIMLAGISGNVTVRGSATLTQGSSSVVALIALLSLMFHVERARPLARIMRRQGIKDLIFIILALVAFMLATVDLVVGPNGRYPVTWRWIVSLGCGTLLGMILASIALTPLIRSVLSIQIDQIPVRFFSRWTFLLEGLALILACAGIGMVLAMWRHVAPSIVLNVFIGILLAHVVLVAAACGTCRRLKHILAEAPIPGDGARTLQARHAHLRRAVRRFVGVGSTGALASLFVAVGVFGIVMPPPRSMRRLPAPAISTHPTVFPPKPTVTPAADAKGLTLTQSANDIGITLTSGPIITGNDIVHVFLANDQGQPITNGIVTLVISPMLVSAGSATIQATADPAGKPGSFVATLNFTQTGTWQIVVLVATADQSMMASVVFSVMVR
jgi:hypothetical protein